MARDSERRIRFRCPQCLEKYSLPTKRAGKSMTCAKCENPIRVPTRDLNFGEALPWWDVLVGRLVWGVAGAAVLFGAAVVLMCRAGSYTRDYSTWLIAMPTIGFVLGITIGEPFVGWLRRHLGPKEDDT